MDPPRPISNRAVKRGSAAGTGASALGDKVRAPSPPSNTSQEYSCEVFLFDKQASIFYHADEIDTTRGY